jgi:uncharacterized protein (DUF58 family)
MIPTPRLALVVALSAPVWLLSGSPPGVAIVAGVTGLVLLLALADALALPRTQQLRVRRMWPAAIGLGDAGQGLYRIESSWPLPLDFELHDAATPAVERIDPAVAANMPWRVARLRVPALGAVEQVVELAGRERGEHTLAPLVLRARGPLGLTQRSLRYDPGDTISVVPSIAGVRRYRLLALQRRLREAGVRTLRRRGEGTSFANLREYVEGDDPRHIDWKASARRSKLITREYALEQGQTVMIVVDAGRMMTQLVAPNGANGETAGVRAPGASVSRFEYALASATVLADVATRSGDHVGLMVFNDEVRAFVPPGKGAFTLQRIRDALLPMNARMVEPDYAGAFRTLAARNRKRSLIVIFTDLIDPRASRSLIAHTVRNTARHLPLVVALRNDELVAAAIPPEHGENALFESAAAEELLQEREEALARMRRSGVSVLDVSPRIMTAAVVNRYLAIKARAAL